MHILSILIISSFFVSSAYSFFISVKRKFGLFHTVRMSSDETVDRIMKSLHRTITTYEKDPIDWTALQLLLSETVHKSHKDWLQTELAAARLAEILGGPDDDSFQHIFNRVLTDGNWFGASDNAKNVDSRPWIVLVTGLNGIRKSTSVYQPWFKQVLLEALGTKYEGTLEALPSGTDSFFRQLDYMIATVANIEFQRLYEKVAELFEAKVSTKENISQYSAGKERIFSTYRMISEMLGILLIKAAQRKNMNIMVETSGRDVAMFKYIDHLFPDEGLGSKHSYRKLVVHFTINDIKLAETSVDSRMLREMEAGFRKIKEGGNVREIIQTNSGGPYGSEVLHKVQAESQSVWESVSKENCPAIDASWLKAHIHIKGSEKSSWTVQAVTAEGISGREYEFVSL